MAVAYMANWSQEDRYKRMRESHKTCDDSHCRCHSFNLGPVPTFGDLVLIEGYLGVGDPASARAVFLMLGGSDRAYAVVGGRCSVPDGEDGIIDSFSATVTSVDTGALFEPGKVVILDIDNMTGDRWKLLTALDRLAVI